MLLVKLMNALGALETFLHAGLASVPLLARCGLAHAQSETIHPFLDGNGRVGRLLITFMLCEGKALTRPLLHLRFHRESVESTFKTQHGFSA